MNCPACGKPLVVVERDAVEVDWCPACHGLWLDAGELELLAKAAGHGAGIAFDGPPAPSQRRCPRCPAKMEERAVAQDPPVRIEACPRGHGLWLDQGELGALVRALPDAAARPGATMLGSFLGETFRSAAAAGGEPSGGSR